MKDILISGRSIFRELLIYAGCVVAALCVNAYSIVRFKTEWRELITMFHITFAVAVILFLVVAVLRIIAVGLRRLRTRRAE